VVALQLFQIHCSKVIPHVVEISYSFSRSLARCKLVFLHVFINGLLEYCNVVCCDVIITDIEIHFKKMLNGCGHPFGMFFFVFFSYYESRHPFHETDVDIRFTFS